VKNTEMIVLRSGKQYDIYSRIRARIKGLSNGTVSFSSYKVELDYIFVLRQSNEEVEYLRFLSESVSMKTRISENIQVGTIYKFQLNVDNGVASKFLENTLQVVDGPPASSIYLKGNKIKIEGPIWEIEFSKIIGSVGSGENMKLVNIKNEKEQAPIKADLISIEQD